MNSLYLIFLISITSTSQFQLPPCKATPMIKQQSKSYLLSQRQILTNTIYNFSIIVDRQDKTISDIIQHTGTWQPSLIRALNHLIRSQFHVLNVGSQTGLEAIIIGKIIGNKGKLYIIQPYSVSYSIVKKNIYLNDLENITRLFRVAASDIQGKGHIIVGKENTGGAQVYLKNIPEGLSKRNMIKEQVLLDLIDNIIEDHVIIDFVLMDVEKMQVQTLLGMKKVIDRSPNIILMVQWQYQANSNRNQAKTLRLLDWLIEKQFKVYRYIENKEKTCQLGQFRQIGQIKELMEMEVTDVFMVPGHIDLNDYH